MYFLKRFFLLFVLVLLGFECNVFAHSDYFFRKNWSHERINQ